MTVLSAPRTRSTTRFLGPTLTDLPPELFTNILSFLAPRNNLTNRRLLSPLLLVSPLLTPYVRQRLFSKISLTLGDKRGTEYKLLNLLDREAVAEHVRSLRIHSPDADEFGLDLLVGEDAPEPGLALVPVERIGQNEVVKMVVRSLKEARSNLRLEVETRIGTLAEGQEEEEGMEEGWEESLESAFKGMKRLQALVVGVPHRKQLLQVWAEGQETISPWIGALRAWDQLTTLDLWRVKIELPDEAPQPTYRLKSFSLSSSDLGNEHDLIFLVGCGSSPRTSQLQDIAIFDVDFSSTPGSSSPLLSLFTSTPSFATTLKKLQLKLSDPIPPLANDASLTSPYTSLQSLFLSGEGATVHLLPTPFSPSLTHLDLSYTPSIPIPTLHTIFPLHTSPPSFPSLKTLEIHHNGSPSRHLTWDQVRLAPPIRWEWTEKEFRTLHKSVRSFGGVMRRNGIEVEWEEGESGSEGDDDDETESEEEDENELFYPSSEQEGEVNVFRRDWSEESDY